MSEILILNPNDQPTGKWRLINDLRECLKNPEFNSLRIAVAFAKTGPLYRLHSEIHEWREKGKSLEGIFGIDHCGTSRQALEFASENFSKVKLLHFGGWRTFHPKMYLFCGARRCQFFIGSHNLTVGGTETNWESGTKVTLNLPEDQAVLKETLIIWQTLFSMSVDLTPMVLAYFDGLGKLLDETKLPRQKSGMGTGSSTEIAPPPGVSWPQLDAKPPSPLPKSLFPRNASRRRSNTRRSGKAKHVNSVPAEALVIQIVPHHNGEVFLSKIAVNQNPAFFGFPFKGHTIPKKTGNPSYPQRTPDPVVNLTVFGADNLPIVRLPRFALNTVFYEAKSEIRVTVPPDVVKNTPKFSILVLRQGPPNGDYDYDFEIFPPGHPQFKSYLEVCNQSMPSGGNRESRKMGWL